MEVRLVRNARELRAFIDLPYRLHAADPNWVPPLRIDMRQRLSRKRNPFFEHGEADYFVALRDGRVVGRIAAVANRLHDRTYGDGTAFFGFFESEDDQEIADALFDVVAAWAEKRGYARLRGPTSFSLNEECGLLVDGFATPPVLMMTHNPPYYVTLFGAAGFHKIKNLLAFAGGGDEVPTRGARAFERLRSRLGVTVRPIDSRKILAEAERIRESYNTYWRDNWGFVPMTAAEIRHMVNQFKPFYVPDLIQLVEKDGRLIAFALALPDLNEVLRSNRSGRLFPAVLKLLWSVRRRKLGRIRVPMLGVVPEYRGKGVDAILWHAIWTAAIANRSPWAEASWILEDNPGMTNAAERMGFTRYKSYGIYDRTL